MEDEHDERVRADERAKINKHIDELKEIYSLMVKYFSWVNIFNEKTELEKLALKISTDGMRVLGSIIDEYKGTLAGTYERETCEMLRKVFVDADMLVEHDEKIRKEAIKDERYRIFWSIMNDAYHEDNAKGWNMVSLQDVLDIIEPDERGKEE